MQLHRDFRGKCYLCEIDQLQSVEVKHLKSHHNGKDRDRMFDWNNLFYSCSHCNSVKNKKKYEDCILDCCQVDPEEYICQELVDGLQRTMTVLYRSLKAYKEDPTMKNLRTVRGLINRNHRFAGFTRTYVRTHINEYPALIREIISG